jgi:hypothetical protein
LVLMAKVLGVALAVGLDVLAVSAGVGVMQLVLNVRVRLGFAFAGSEIAMQVIVMNLAQAPERCWARLPPYVGLAPQPLLPLSHWHLTRVSASGTSTVLNVRQARCS